MGNVCDLGWKTFLIHEGKYLKGKIMDLIILLYILHFPLGCV